ncbi:hypothetical protein P0Y35_11665 [Kiritimatiellaeota bacterium B1221]|nr:hypothetical protein [Kiritimatiellaeota bacterium B1221]
MNARNTREIESATEKAIKIINNKNSKYTDEEMLQTAFAVYFNSLICDKEKLVDFFVGLVDNGNYGINENGEDLTTPLDSILYHDAINKAITYIKERNEKEKALCDAIDNIDSSLSQDEVDKKVNEEIKKAKENGLKKNSIEFVLESMG